MPIRASSRALALATEHFGNDPLAPGFPDISADARALANLKQRFYWYEVNGNPTFFYRGDATSLSEALLKFAAVPTGEVVFLPGRGHGHSLGGEKAFDYDWWFNFPAGLHHGGVPTLTVYIAAVDPPKPPDAKQLAGWIADLDSDTFATRSKASEELKKLGYDAAPALHRALENKPSAEVRNAIEHLLGVLDGIDIREVKVPKGVKVLEVKDLLARHRDQLKASDATTRGLAAGALGYLADYADVVPDLIGVLKDDAHEYARRSAAGAFAVGKGGDISVACPQGGAGGSRFKCAKRLYLRDQADRGGQGNEGR